MAEARVLIVEDNADDAALIQRGLADVIPIGNTRVAQCGHEALDYLFARGACEKRDDRDQPDLIFLDLRLPDLAGDEVLQRIRADPRTRSIPTVVLSGIESLPVRLEAYRDGANSYLVKPVDPEAFPALVRRAGHYWLSVNQVVPIIRAALPR